MPFDAAVAAGRVFGASVQAIVVKDDDGSSRYQLLSRAGEIRSAPHRFSAILDASVLIDLERVASGTASRAAEDAAQKLMLRLAHLDVLAGPALLELIGSEGTDRAAAFRRLSAVMDAWFDGGATRVTSLSDVRAAYQRALVEGPSSGFEEPPAQHRTQQAFYAALLKLCCLWRNAQGGFRARQRVELYHEFVRWMSRDLGANCVIPWQVARDRLIGPQGVPANYTDKLLKLGRPSLHAVWGASWDLTHLSTIELLQFSGDIGIGDREVVLVTADQGLMSLRRRIHDVGAVVEVGDFLAPLKIMQTDLDGRIEPFRDLIADIEHSAKTAASERAGSVDSIATVEHVVSEARRLEAEFLALTSA